MIYFQNNQEKGSNNAKTGAREVCNLLQLKIFEKTYFKRAHVVTLNENHR